MKCKDFLTVVRSGSEQMERTESTAVVSITRPQSDGVGGVAGQIGDVGEEGLIVRGRPAPGVDSQRGDLCSNQFELAVLRRKALNQTCSNKTLSLMLLINY